VAQEENVAPLSRRGAPARGAAQIEAGRRSLSFWAVVTLVACGGATRPDRDGPRQQRDEVSSADAARSQRDAGDAARAERDAGDDGSPLFCTANIAPGLYVTFAKQTVACDELAVIAADGAYTDVLECSDVDRVRCACFGADERPGTYEVTVSTGEPPIELARSAPITVTATSCHVVTQSAVLQLAVLPADAGVFIGPDAGDE
jgi:hypothetical protein